MEYGLDTLIKNRLKSVATFVGKNGIPVLINRYALHVIERIVRDSDSQEFEQRLT